MNADERGCEFSRFAAAIVGGDRAARLRLGAAAWRWLAAERRFLEHAGDGASDRRAAVQAAIDALRARGIGAAYGGDGR